MSDGPTLGKYVIERRIASGGMANVYLARQQGSYGFVKRIALKVLKREVSRDDENVRMFIREALVAAEFHHPNLAQVYEVGETDGQLFIAMELVRGISLASLVRELTIRKRPLQREVGVKIIVDVLDGLSHAHEARGPDGRQLGLIHRDISPQNIMVTTEGVVKIVDFGIARAENAFGRTLAPRIKGKFSYMAPEQWEASGRMDARADLFAVGVVSYEITTGGARLFRGETPQDLYRAAVLESIPDPRTRDPAYPAELVSVVMRALERGVGARWSSARAMRAAVLECAEHEGWTLSPRGLGDSVRAALGTDDVESRWEIVVADGGDPFATTKTEGEVTTVDPAVDPEGDDAPTSVHSRGNPPKPAAIPPRAARVPIAVAPKSAGAHAPPAMGSQLAGPVAAAVIALAAGLFGGFALGRARGQPHASGAPIRLRIADPLHVSWLVNLQQAWSRAHPELPLEVIAWRGGVSELRFDGAEIAIVPAEVATRDWPVLSTRGIGMDASARVEFSAGGSRWIAVGPGVAVGPPRAFFDWLRGPEFASRPAEQLP